jgi:hypothetical protein
MAYVVFDKRQGRTVNPITTITRYGRIAFNKGASKVLSEKRVNRLLLMWDAVNHKIGLKPVGKDDKDVRGYDLFRNERDNSAFVHAKTFLDWLQYDYRETRKYNFEWNEKEGVIEITVPGEAIRKDLKPVPKRAIKPKRQSS